LAVGVLLWSATAAAQDAPATSPVAGPTAAEARPDSSARVQPVAQGADVPRPARPDCPAYDCDRHHHGFLPEGWFVPVGVNVGFAVHGERPIGALFGGEISIVRNPIGNALWAGAYVDALYDTGEREARVSMGPEFGAGPIGVDLGLYRTLASGAAGDRFGIRGRGFLTLGIVALYAGYGHTLGDSRWMFESGVLFKFPIQVTDDHAAQVEACRRAHEHERPRCSEPFR
jgi:hypothetical protein